jgi:hypothetical protein
MGLPCFISWVYQYLRFGLGKFHAFFLSWLCGCTNNGQMAKTNSIHQESIDFITNNINAKTSEIPKHLLEYWCVPEHIEKDIENSVSTASYLIFLHAHKTYNKTLGKEIELSSIEEIGLFEQFQLIIQVALGEENFVKISPINLFDFDNYSKLNITIL